MQSAEKIEVLIAHANPLVTAGLMAALRAEQDLHILEHQGGHDSTNRMRARIAITDYERGIGLLSTDRCIAHRVLILTDDEGEVNIRRAIDLGVRGYLPLASGVETVVSAVRSIHNGGVAISPRVMTKVNMSLRSQRLTERELAVLRLLMHGLKDRVIAQRLVRSIDTVKSHVKSILAKLDASSRLEAVEIARRRGLVPEETPAAAVERRASPDTQTPPHSREIVA